MRERRVLKGWSKRTHEKFPLGGWSNKHLGGPTGETAITKAKLGDPLKQREDKELTCRNE